MPSKAQTIIHLHRTRPELTAGEIAAACKTTEGHVGWVLAEYYRARVRRKARWTGVPATGSNHNTKAHG